LNGRPPLGKKIKTIHSQSDENRQQQLDNWWWKNKHTENIKKSWNSKTGITSSREKLIIRAYREIICKARAQSALIPRKHTQNVRITEEKKTTLDWITLVIDDSQE
jgi:hypothetical protein